MLTIGLLGGMSWESSLEYYRLINRGVRARLGGQHSARLVLLSLDFAEIARLQHAGDWDTLGALMVAEARRLRAAGADFLVIATNTMHVLAPRIETETGLPVLHIASATGAAIRSAKVGTVGLLGTRFTMEQPFFAERLAQEGVTTIIPEEPDRALVHRVIYDELVQGEVNPASRAALSQVIARLVDAGAGGIVLGCTELMLLVQPEDSAVPLFDTTALHAAAAVAAALEG